MTTDPAALHARPKLAPRVRLQNDPVTGQSVLLYPEGILELNDSAREIVALCDGAASVQALVERLAAEYDASPDELRDDVLACLRDLEQRQLLDFA